MGQVIGGLGGGGITGASIGAGAMGGGSMGKAVGGLGQGILSPFTTGKLGDTLFGKEDPGQAAGVVDITPGKAQLDKAIDQYGNLLTDNKQIVANQISSQENAARQAVKDQQMNIQDQIAQRGMGNSAAGLTALTGAESMLGDRINQIRAQAPGLEQENLNRISGGLANVTGARGQGIIYNKAVASTGRLPGGAIKPIMEGAKIAAGPPG